MASEISSNSEAILSIRVTARAFSWLISAAEVLTRYPVMSWVRISASSSRFLIFLTMSPWSVSESVKTVRYPSNISLVIFASSRVAFSASGILSSPRFTILPEMNCSRREGSCPFGFGSLTHRVTSLAICGTNQISRRIFARLKREWKMASLNPMSESCFSVRKLSGRLSPSQSTKFVKRKKMASIQTTPITLNNK